MNGRIISLTVASILIVCICARTPGKVRTPYMLQSKQHTARSYTLCPVCDMVKDSTWKEYTLYKNDTVWFCSADDKNAFVSHPKKYAGKLGK